MAILPGFVGYADINSTYVRCNDFSVNLKQEPLFYDHMVGLRDGWSVGVPTIYDIKGDNGDQVVGGLYNKQKILWRPGVKISQGGFTFPWTDGMLDDGGGTPVLWEEARGAKEFDMNFYYSCDMARKFTGCRINTYSFKVSAGDIVSSTADIMAIHMEDLDASSIGQITTSNKILTWDSVAVTCPDIIDSSTSIVSLEFNINNSLMPIYTAGNNADVTNPLEAKEIRAGMQSLTGSLSLYNTNNINYLEPIIAPKTITVDIAEGLFSFNLTVIFNPMTQTSSIGPVIRTMQFTGIDYNIE